MGKLSRNFRIKKAVATRYVFDPCDESASESSVSIVQSYLRNRNSRRLSILSCNLRSWDRVRTKQEIPVRDRRVRKNRLKERFGIIKVQSNRKKQPLIKFVIVASTDNFALFLKQRYSPHIVCYSDSSAHKNRNVLPFWSHIHAVPCCNP